MNISQEKPDFQFESLLQRIAVIQRSRQFLEIPLHHFEDFFFFLSNRESQILVNVEDLILDQHIQSIVISFRIVFVQISLVLNAPKILPCSIELFIIFY